jgi:hypothetical protein
VTRTMRGLLLGLALAGAVAPATGQTSRIERDFDLIRRADGRPLQNVYWVSLPLDPVIADSAGMEAGIPGCVGDPRGPATGDGSIDAFDLVCAWWTARSSPDTAGAFTVIRHRAEDCTMVAASGVVALGAIRLVGTRFALEDDGGYEVRVTVPTGATFSPRNHAILEGAHDPTWPGRTIDYAPTCTGGATTSCCGPLAARRELLHYPATAIEASADEILCGLENVDWGDFNGDGNPDTCWNDRDRDRRHDAGEEPTGVFDGRSAIALGTWVNTEAVDSAIWRTATTALGVLRFTGTSFALRDGDAYMLQLSATHSPTLYLPVSW